MIGESIGNKTRSRFSKKVLIPTLASLAFLSGCGSESGASAAAPNAPASVSSSANSSVKFQFDNLGSTYPGSEYVQVYPGPLDNPVDKKKNGTFNNKDIVKAICIATGRKLTPDSHYSELPRPEEVQDKWVKVDDDPVQFASLTYGRLIPPDAQLPPCEDVR